MVLGLLLLSVAAAAQLNPLCTVGNERYRLELVRLGSCCPAQVRVLLETAGSAQAEELQFTARLGTLHRLRILQQSILTLAGQFGIGENSLVFLDLADPTTPVELWTYGHQFSPSQRQVAYISHYSTSDPPESQRSILLLYRISAPPEENRLESSAAPATRPGIPIFPPANVEQASYDPTLEAKHVFVSPLLWSDDERRLVFVDSFDGQYHLVRIGLERGAGSPDIARRQLSLNELRPPSGSRQAPPDAPLAVVSLRWRNESTVAVLAAGRTDVVELAVP